MRAVLKGIHAIVEDVNEARKVYSLGFYGRPLTTGKPKGPEDINEPLILSLIEAVYLAEQGVLEVFAEDGRKLSVEELKTCGSKAIDRFDVLYGVYSDLRRKGFVVRSGMKYGADFAVYSVGPGLEHAPYLVIALKYGQELKPHELLSFGRVSHSTRKELILAIVGPGKVINYVSFKWTKI
ncbi:MAG: tRNA-intron lyase [Sulfolobales archaeon]|nr:tRNA-intron lyase [Sulfolobales archaeon]